MAVVGSADVIVRAITSKVKSDIDKAFKDLRPVVQASGERLGKDFSNSFGKSLDNNLPGIIETAVQAAAAGAGAGFVDSLAPSGAEAGRRVGNGFDLEVGKHGGRGGRGVGRNFFRELGDAIRREVPAAINRILLLSGAFELLGPLIGIAIAGVSSLTSGLFAMAAAASQAVAVIAVLPSILAAAGQAFGAIKLAFGGITEALGLGAKAQDAAAVAAPAAAKAATGARDLAAANAELQAAQDAAAAAADKLKKAQERAANAGKGLGDAESRLAAAIAERNRVMSDPNASQADGAAAQAAVDAAQAAYDAISKEKEKALKRQRKAAEEADRAQAKLDKAQKKRDKAAAAGGIPESPAVKAANAYNAALAALTPEARAFVIEILEMRKRFKELGEAIGKELFPPLTEALQLIGDSSFFKILEDNLTRTGAIVGELGLNLTKAFLQEDNQTRFSNFLRDNNRLLNLFNKTTEDGTTPAESLVNIILKLFRAVQPLTMRFGRFLATVITGFDKAHSVADLSGMFKKSGNVAAQLFRIIGNVFSAIRILGGGSKRTGRQLLKSFEDATEKFEDFARRVREDGSLKKYMEGVKRNVKAIGRLVVNLGEEFGALGDNEGVSKFADELQPGIDSLGDLLDKLSSGETGEAFGKLTTQLIELIDAATQSEALATFLDTLRGFAFVVTSVIEAFNKLPFAGLILKIFAVYKATKLLFFLAGLSGVFKALTSPLTRLVGALGRLAAMPFRKISNGLKSTGGKHRAGVPPVAASAETTEALAQGERIGKAMSQGIAAGLRAGTPQVIAAIDDLGDAAILALKAKLGIASPSVVFTRLGDNTADGFVLGLRAGTDDAYRAGAGLGTAAAAGARSTAAGAAAAGATAGVAAKGAGAAAVIPAGNAAALSKSAAPIGKMAKLAGPFSKLGKAFSALSLGLLGISGPVLLVIGAIVLLIVGLKKLYGVSPEFRKFVDGIVDKFQQLGNWFKEILMKYVVPVLNDFFRAVNDNLPKIKRIFFDVMDAIAPIVGIAFKLIKFYVTKILIPVWKRIFGIVKALIPIFRDTFNSVREKVQTTFAAMKVIYEKVLRPLFVNLAQTVKEKIDRAREIIDTLREKFNAVKDKLSDIGDRIGEIFTGVRDSVVGAFTGLKAAISGPLNEVISFINDHLIDNINKVTENFGLKIPRIAGFAEGGYTGPGSKYKVAGVVHADEHVIKASSRRKIERAYPGMLDTINKTGKLPGFGIGGFGPIGDIAGGVADLAGDVVGGIKDVGEAISKKGLGAVLKGIITGFESAMSAAGFSKTGFVNKFMFGILDKLEGAVDNWGGNTGKGALSGGGPWGKPFAGSWPITQYANNGKHKPSYAIDFGLPDGTAVLAAAGGRVSLVADKGSTSYGKYMTIDHGGGVSTLYAHLQSWSKSIGNQVTKGMQIALSGHTGGVRSSTGGTGAHLHFEIRPGSDTLEELRKRGVKLARGGVARSTPGGILSVIAEAGKNERVEPLDSNGMSKRDKEIMKLFAANGRGGDLTVNVHNPAPERASVSVAKGIRSKAVSKGWNV